MYPNTVPRGRGKRMKKLFFRIFRKKIDEYRDFSIQKKISVAFVLLLVPLILFVLIWFVCALDATNRYDKVVRNTSIISEFNLDFKKNYDYKNRILDVFKNHANSTKKGLANGIARELGLRKFKVWTLSSIKDRR